MLDTLQKKGLPLAIIVITAVCFIFVFGAVGQAEDIQAEEEWITGLTGSLDVDQVELVESLEDFSRPLIYLENYLYYILPEIEEPGVYSLASDSQPEGLFSVEAIEQLELQFDEQPEDWNEGDEWTWTFRDDDRYVEIELTSEVIDYVKEPGRPMLSRIIFSLDYAAPHFNFQGTVRVRDDFDDVDVIVELDHADYDLENIYADLNFDLLNRVENELTFEGSLQLPGIEGEGEHHFIFTERPRELPRTQPIYLDEYIFRGYMTTGKFALEGDMWICTESIVLNGYTVLN